MTLLAPPRYVDLKQMREQDSQLNNVLTLAQDGEGRPLQRWLVEQTPEKRRALAGAI